MEVWIVLIDHVTTRPTELSDDDGYYDDYYDEEFHESEIICVCDSEKLADKKVKEYETANHVYPLDTVYYIPYQVLTEDKLSKN